MSEIVGDPSRVRDASGQRVNFLKSAVIFGKGLAAGKRNAVVRLLGIKKIDGFGRYLGLPEMVGRSKADTFSFVKQRVMNKLHNW